VPGTKVMKLFQSKKSEDKKKEAKEMFFASFL